MISTRFGVPVNQLIIWNITKLQIAHVNLCIAQIMNVNGLSLDHAMVLLVAQEFQFVNHLHLHHLQVPLLVVTHVTMCIVQRDSVVRFSLVVLQFVFQRVVIHVTMSYVPHTITVVSIMVKQFVQIRSGHLHHHLPNGVNQMHNVLHINNVSITDVYHLLNHQHHHHTMDCVMVLVVLLTTIASTGMGWQSVSKMHSHNVNTLNVHQITIV